MAIQPFTPTTFFHRAKGTFVKHHAILKEIWAWCPPQLAAQASMTSEMRHSFSQMVSQTSMAHGMCQKLS